MWLCRLPLLTGSMTAMLTAQLAETVDRDLPAVTETCKCLQYLQCSILVRCMCSQLRVFAVSTCNMTLVSLPVSGSQTTDCHKDARASKPWPVCLGSKVPLHCAAGTMMWRLTTRTDTTRMTGMNSKGRAAMVEIAAEPQQVKEPQEHQGYGAGPLTQEAILTGTEHQSCTLQLAVDCRSG